MEWQAVHKHPLPDIDPALVYLSGKLGRSRFAVYQDGYIGKKPIEKLDVRPLIWRPLQEFQTELTHQAIDMAGKLD